jgi:hypothetical protein
MENKDMNRKTWKKNAALIALIGVSMPTLTAFAQRATGTSYDGESPFMAPSIPKQVFEAQSAAIHAVCDPAKKPSTMYEYYRGNAVRLNALLETAYSESTIYWGKRQLAGAKRNELDENWQENQFLFGIKFSLDEMSDSSSPATDTLGITDSVDGGIYAELKDRCAHMPGAMRSRYYGADTTANDIKNTANGAATLQSAVGGHALAPSSEYAGSAGVVSSHANIQKVSVICSADCNDVQSSGQIRVFGVR